MKKLNLDETLVALESYGAGWLEGEYACLSHDGLGWHSLGSDPFVALERVAFYFQGPKWRREEF